MLICAFIQTQEREMAREPEFVLEYLKQVESLADDVLADRRDIIELNKKRDKSREASRLVFNNNNNIIFTRICCMYFYVNSTQSPDTKRLKSAQEERGRERAWRTHMGVLRQLVHRFYQAGGCVAHWKRYFAYWSCIALTTMLFNFYCRLSKIRYREEAGDQGLRLGSPQPRAKRLPKRTSRRQVEQHSHHITTLFFLISSYPLHMCKYSSIIYIKSSLLFLCHNKTQKELHFVFCFCCFIICCCCCCA